MALGSSSLRYVDIVIQTVLAMNPRSVLDLGMGTGKYGILLREQHDLAQSHWGKHDWRLRLVGVEAYGPYVGTVQRAVYDDVVIADVRDYLASAEERFDVALALDVLEHFTPQGGRDFTKAVLEAADVMVVLTPRGFYRQDDHENTLERHLSWWPPKALKRLASSVGADVAVTRTSGASLAALSRTRAPALAVERKWREAAIGIRDALVPDAFWCRVRGKTGPMLEVAAGSAHGCNVGRRPARRRSSSR
jgi:SAM-dependent methyltransferase